MTNDPETYRYLAGAEGIKVRCCIREFPIMRCVCFAASGNLHRWRRGAVWGRYWRGGGPAGSHSRWFARPPFPGCSLTCPDIPDFLASPPSGQINKQTNKNRFSCWNDPGSRVLMSWVKVEVENTFLMEAFLCSTRRLWLQLMLQKCWQQS